VEPVRHGLRIEGVIMKNLRRYLAAAVAGVFLGVSGLALAQFTGQMPTPGTVANLHQNDLAQIVVSGQASAQQPLASLAQVTSMNGYAYQVPTTGFSITVPTSVGYLILNPAGTLATGTITLPANPTDGQFFCWVSTQTQTAVTITAGAGQTLAGVATETAGVANTQYCRRFVASTNTWYHLSVFG